MNVPEEELIELRNRVAKLYGEDVAQDTIVRVLSRNYRKRWFEWELHNARRRWLVQQKRDNKRIEITERHHPRYSEQNRIEAREELRKVIKSHKGLSVALYETGKKAVSWSWLSEMKNALRKTR